MGKSRRGEGNLPAFDHNADRYPDINEVVAKVLKEEDFPEGAVERLEITTLANGDATWRVWPPRAEEPIGGAYADR